MDLEEPSVLRSLFDVRSAGKVLSCLTAGALISEPQRPDSGMACEWEQKRARPDLKFCNRTVGHPGGCAMNAVDGYRAKAWECLSLAESMNDPERRADMLRFARMWMSLTEPIGDLPIPRSPYELPSRRPPVRP